MIPTLWILPVVHYTESHQFLCLARSIFAGICHIHLACIDAGNNVAVIGSQCFQVPCVFKRLTHANRIAVVGDNLIRIELGVSLCRTVAVGQSGEHNSHTLIDFNML
jgi:hypothetical protein